MELAVVPPARVHPPPVVSESHRYTLALDSTEREYVLCALEVALAVSENDCASARRLAAAYGPAALGRHLDAVADRLFLAGCRRVGAVWRQVGGGGSGANP